MNDPYMVLIISGGGNNLIHNHQPCIVLARLNDHVIEGTQTLERSIFNGSDCAMCGKPLA